MIITILSILLILSLITIGIFLFKNKKTKAEQKLKTDLLNKSIEFYAEKIKKLKSIADPSIKKGFYTYHCIYDDTEKIEYDVFITEIDRYTNGKSKIQLDKIKIFNGYYKVTEEEIFNFVKNQQFREIIDTNSITWLESVDEIQKIRAKKLERVLKEDL